MLRRRRPGMGPSGAFSGGFPPRTPQFSYKRHLISGAASSFPSPLIGDDTLTINDLKHLDQRQAAWLANISTRTLRDADPSELPRDSDGCYNARDVLNWAVGRRVLAIAKLLRDAGDCGGAIELLLQ
jgi:hypothetical protein